MIRLLSACALALLAACQQGSAPVDGSSRVDARHYDAFWLWAGVKPQSVLDTAKTIYILQGEVRGAPVAHMVSQRAATPRVKHAAVWIVYRVETLEWGADIMPMILADLKRWRAAGNDVVGVQIDFDAATKGLPKYAAFLKKLRADLPKDCKLGVTGLLDWSSRAGETDGLNMLAGTVDEVVLQVYQGRHTIPGYQAYLKNLDRLKLPFRMGLVQHGEWSRPDGLKDNAYYRGDVVFLLNPTV